MKYKQVQRQNCFIVVAEMINKLQPTLFPPGIFCRVSKKISEFGIFLPKLLQ